MRWDSVTRQNRTRAGVCDIVRFALTVRRIRGSTQRAGGGEGGGVLRFGGTDGAAERGFDALGSAAGNGVASHGWPTMAQEDSTSSTRALQYCWAGDSEPKMMSSLPGLMPDPIARNPWAPVGRHNSTE